MNVKTASIIFYDHDDELYVKAYIINGGVSDEKDLDDVNQIVDTIYEYLEKGYLIASNFDDILEVAYAEGTIEEDIEKVQNLIEWYLDFIEKNKE